MKYILTVEFKTMAGLMAGVNWAEREGGEPVKTEVVTECEQLSLPVESAPLRPAIAEPVAAPPPLSVEVDLIPAFQKYAKEKSREAAGRILKEYGVKSVKELPSSVWGEVMGRLT